MIIAEIGVNHDGYFNKAIELVKAAKKSGADAVKFQTFEADRLASSYTPKVKYQERSGVDETHHAMLKKLELTIDEFRQIINFCKNQKITFISTPYDPFSALELKKLGQKIFKIASADIVDLELNRTLASFNSSVILSTGMASLDEVQRSIDWHRNKTLDLKLLHCTSNYPCSDDTVNLNAILTLRKAFDLPVGFSDHTVGNTAAIAATSMGVTIFERHFTLCKNDEGPDHAASDDPESFSEYVLQIKRASTMLGSGEKFLHPEETQMWRVSRKSIHAARNLEPGVTLTRDMLQVIRPYSGICASKIEELVGRTLSRGKQVHEPISEQDLD